MKDWKWRSTTKDIMFVVRLNTVPIFFSVFLVESLTSKQCSLIMETGGIQIDSLWFKKINSLDTQELPYHGMMYFNVYWSSWTILAKYNKCFRHSNALPFVCNSQILEGSSARIFNWGIILPYFTFVVCCRKNIKKLGIWWDFFLLAAIFVVIWGFI